MPHSRKAATWPSAMRRHPSFRGEPRREPGKPRALAEIASPGETLIFLQADEFAAARVHGTATALGVQMIADGICLRGRRRIEKLGEADAADMLELATLTKPGPFTLKAQALGDFWGIRENGRLIAMAGERLKQDGLTELSGVCVHPDFQGKGLGRLMTLYAAEKSSPRASSRSCTPMRATRSRSGSTNPSASG